MLADSSYDVFHGAPALVVICATFPEAQAAEDCCLAAQNLMLAAHAAGLATCPIGLARGWLNRPETKAALGIPREYVPVFPVIVGHPAQVPAPTVYAWLRPSSGADRRRSPRRALVRIGIMRASSRSARLGRSKSAPIGESDLDRRIREAGAKKIRGEEP